MENRERKIGNGRSRRFKRWVSWVTLIAGTLMLIPGCTGGKVPNSSQDEIEQAKFDPEQAKQGVGTAVPPD